MLFTHILVIAVLLGNLVTLFPVVGLLALLLVGSATHVLLLVVAHLTHAGICIHLAFAFYTGRVILYLMVNCVADWVGNLLAMVVVLGLVAEMLVVLHNLTLLNWLLVGFPHRVVVTLFLGMVL